MKDFLQYCGICLFLIVIGVGICIGCVVLVAGTTTQIKTQEQFAYDSWVKLTGNERQITLEEWRAMRNYNVLPTEVNINRP